MHDCPCRSSGRQTDSAAEGEQATGRGIAAMSRDVAAMPDVDPSLCNFAFRDSAILVASDLRFRLLIV
jgi:hypothetical protein